MKNVSSCEYEQIKNKNFEELIYYGNLNTKITCLSSCDGKKPLQKNMIIFNSLDEAFDLGYKPCKRCQHIKLEGRIYTSNWKQELKEYIEENYYYDINLTELSNNVGVSKFHLIRSFKEEYFISPINYLINFRLKIAEKMITTTSKPISDIGFEVGFKSYAHFEKSFKKYFNKTPTEARM